MKRLYLFLIAAVICVMSMRADGEAFTNLSGYWGIRASYNLTVPGSLTMSDNKTESVFKAGSGFEVGVTRQIPLVSGLYLEPGAMVFMDTYSVEKDKVYIFQNGTSVSLNKFGLRIPVMLGWHFDLGETTKLYVFTGPELEVGFLGKVKYGQPHKDISYDTYNAKNPLRLRNFAGLWGVGLGVSYKKYYLGVSGDFGFTNMYNYSDRSFHENHIKVTLGMNLKTYHRTKKVSAQP